MLLREARNDPQGDRNKMYMPGVDNAANPFSNGFFKGPKSWEMQNPMAGLMGPGEDGKPLSVPEFVTNPMFPTSAMVPSINNPMGGAQMPKQQTMAPKPPTAGTWMPSLEVPGTEDLYMQGKPTKRRKATSGMGALVR